MKKAAYIAVAVIFALDCILHFVFEWSGGLPVIGAFCPVNESIWEHLKLAFFPLMIWWMALGGRFGLNAGRRTVASAVSACTASLAIVMIHYTYSGAIGFRLTAVDIGSLPVAMALGQYLALEALKRPYKKQIAAAACVLLIVVGLLLAVFTFVPPHIPLFWDAEGGFYGIRH